MNKRQRKKAMKKSMLKFIDFIFAPSPIMKYLKKKSGGSSNGY